ncbi:uncharacterized protein LOC126843771 isoform X1 [Adelges cooleyi]|uniref:uncharacterized protein LOC126843771 isoform X1 n=1 Tax=Adelges cooleyi TaxID=133065 RepID=UPI00217F5597|nr:uncharacterized protein LOC126843771 isoform X1 [Adelges cooleyi]
MSFLYVIIPFALVNVFVAAVDRYTTEVFRANLHLKQAKDQLPAVIKAIVIEDFLIKDVSFMLASPDNEEEHVDLKYDKIVYQIFLQDIITRTTGIPAITVLNDEMKNQLEEANLRDLAIARRKLIIEPVKHLIRSIIRGQFREEFADFVDVCRLIGVLKAIEHPTSAIEWSDFFEETNGRCIISYFDHKIYFYKTIENEIWEVDREDNQLHLLADQVN